MPKFQKIAVAVIPPIALLVVGGFLLGIEPTRTITGWVAVIMGAVGFISSLWSAWN